MFINKLGRLLRSWDTGNEEAKKRLEKDVMCHAAEAESLDLTAFRDGAGGGGSPLK